MRFEWNQAKNESNIHKHGIDFADVENMFNYPVLASPDSRGDYSEERWVAIGRMLGLVCVVVYTERRGDMIRIISARKATRYEINRYEKSIKN